MLIKLTDDVVEAVAAAQSKDAPKDADYKQGFIDGMKYIITANDK